MKHTYVFAALALTLISMEAVGRERISLYSESPQSGNVHTVVMNPHSQTAEVLIGDFPAERGLSREERAKKLARELPSVFRLFNVNNELELVTETTDQLGLSHLRFNQTYQGIEVWGCQKIFHFGRDDDIYMVAGQTIPSPDIDIKPNVTASDAAVVAVEHLTDQQPPQEIVTNQRLLIVPEENSPHLAWQVTVTGKSIPFEWVVFVDAHSGQFLHKHNALCSDGPVLSSGPDLWNVNREFHAYQIGSDISMIDGSRSMFTPPVDDLNGVIVTYKEILSGSDPVIDPNQDGIFDDNDVLKAAVSCHYWTEQSFEYFYDRFGLNSWDGSGGTVRVSFFDSADYNNAFFTLTELGDPYIGFGDGDGEKFREFHADPDIVGHEFTHGVTHFSAGLIYTFESGALNESFSDFFGNMIDGTNWLMGDQTVLADPGYLRNMENPHLGYGYPFEFGGVQPAHLSEFVDMPIGIDNGGVHFNSGIPNRVGYLVASTIGRESAAEIWYRTLTVYLTPSSSFDFWALMLTTAADDLYGSTSPEFDAVVAALDSVGFGSVLVFPSEIDGGVLVHGELWDTVITLQNRTTETITITDIESSQGHVEIGTTLPVTTSISNPVSIDLYFDATEITDPCDIGTIRDTLEITTSSIITPEILVPIELLLGAPTTVLDHDTAVITPTNCFEIRPTNRGGLERLFSLFDYGGYIGYRGHLFKGNLAFIVMTVVGVDTIMYQGFTSNYLLLHQYPEPNLVPVQELEYEEAINSDSLVSGAFASNDGRIKGTFRYQYETGGMPIGYCGTYITVEYTLTSDCPEPQPVLSGIHGYILNPSYEGTGDTIPYLIDSANHMITIPWVPQNTGDSIVTGLAALDDPPRNVRLITHSYPGVYYNPGHMYRQMEMTEDGIQVPNHDGGLSHLITFAMDSLQAGKTLRYRAAYLYSREGHAGLHNVLDQIHATSPSACCELRADLDHSGSVDISDLVHMVDYMFSGGIEPYCYYDASIDGLGEVDISDLVYFVDYMFTGGDAPPPCP